ncbi:flagellar protein FlgN [Halanaerobium sp. Z-7514]|uniref:Flagellar protein FlgN n=1 Tax=Halanaerobium polyolivorans TaxID=2886943 RepID=A0AAW4WZ68_9FIRM|nr:flagellar protein FlgN [Halanaerobium polyolivorans]MCC3145172.1 flagellar protein FlgN [Halanaerobium polyolivorans]
MSELKTRLADILRVEKELYQKLFQAAQAKNEALLNNDIDQLLEEVEIDKKIIPLIEDKELARTKTIAEIKKAFKIEEDKDSYSALLKELPADWSAELNPLREELLSLTEEFNSLNKQNQLLLKQALELNQLSLQSILNNLEDQTTYSRPTAEQNQPRILNQQG